MTDKTSGGTQTQRVTYEYDAFHRLTERTYQTTSGGPVTEGYFIYDGIQMILQLDDSADVEHRLLWGPAIDQALADETGGGDVYWYLADHLGTLRDVVEYNDRTNTTSLANHIVFDSFGRRTSETNSSLGAFDIGYSGKWFDRNTRLAWHWNRWYNPDIERWMSEDPKRSDANGYRYAGNMTTTYVDQNGLEYRGYWEGVGDVFRGYGDAAVATGQGAWYVVRHPFRSARGLKDSLERTIADPVGTFNAVCDHVSDKASTLRGQGELIGDLGIGVLTGGAFNTASRTRVFARFSRISDNAPILPRNGGQLSVSERVFTLTDAPVNLGRPRGTFVTEIDITQPSNLIRHFDQNVPPSPCRPPGSLPRYVTEIQVPQGSVLPDPTVPFRFNDPTGWIPPSAVGPRIGDVFEVIEDATGNVNITPNVGGP